MTNTMKTKTAKFSSEKDGQIGFFHAKSLSTDT